MPHKSPPSPRAISSLANDRVKFIRALEMRKTRRETGLFVAEGAAITITAAEHGVLPEILVVRQGADLGPVAAVAARVLEGGGDVLEVTEAILEKLAVKDNPQTVLGVFRQRWAEPPNPSLVPASATWLALEEIRDPGNLGTIIRTAEAAGAAGVVLVGTCCDAWSRECVRATMGSVFAVPLARMEHAAFAELMGAWPGDSVGTHLAASDDFRRVRYRDPVLLVMGSEGPGLSDAVARSATRLVRIPMAGALDSLNLSIATALALYEIRRNVLG